MVFAKAEELDIFDDHHFVVCNRVERPIHNLGRVRPIATGQETESLIHSVWRLGQAFATRIFSQPLKNCRYLRRDRERLWPWSEDLDRSSAVFHLPSNPLRYAPKN